MRKIAIIGGGAAGMMAAIAAKESAKLAGSDVDVMLFEKNTYLGAKVLISGGGRCNVTTGIFDVRKLLENYPRGAKFLMSAMFRFPPDKVMEWFKTHGVRLRMEEDLRIFPASNQGKDVVVMLEKELRANGVQIFLDTNVAQVERRGENFSIQLKDGKSFEADAVILTTGGNAYRQTGSTGDGYAFAKALGHTITPLAPSLNSFLVSDTWVGALAGVSFPKVQLTFKNFEGTNVYERKGPIVFTHHGVSGPAVFAISSMAAYEKYSSEKPLQLSINFFPDEKVEDLRARLIKLMEANGKKKLVNFLDIFLPKSLCEVMVKILGVDTDLIVGKVNKELREAVLKLLQHFPFSVIGRGGGDEFVTAGGVDLKEVNTNTMESKICPGLFFAGEILDIDGFTGGYNLQAAWAMGKLAGESAI